MYSSQGELSKKVGNLEVDRLSKEVQMKDAEQRVETAEQMANDIKGSNGRFNG